MSKDQKIQISIGCTDFLVSEIETLRKQNEILSTEKRIVDNFFGMINRLNGPQTQSYSHDMLYQAKKEISEAIKAIPEVTK